MDAKQLVAATCKKYPEAGNRTLARLLAEQYPHAFTIERARDAIRRARGAIGQKMRKELKDTSARQPLRKAGTTITIPKGVKQSLPDLEIHTTGKWLLCSDIHVPYHDEVAVEAMIRYARKERVQNVYINGDLLDFYQLSRFLKDPRYRNPDEEIETGIEVLKEFAKHFRGERYCKKGNHEDRYEKYLYERAPALVGIKAFELDRVMELESLGYRPVQSRQTARLGKLPVFHGHEMPGGSAVNVGRGIYLRARESAVVGHWHRTSNHVDATGLTKRITGCWSIGCLCDLTPEYAKVNQWNQGFAIVTVNDDGKYRFQNKIIDSGEVFDA